MTRGSRIVLAVVVMCAFAAAFCAVAAHAQSVDPVMGNWEGKFVKSAKPITAQIIARGKQRGTGIEQYKALVTFGEPVIKFDMMGDLAKGKVVFKGEQPINGNPVKLQMTAQNGKIKGKVKGSGAFAMERVIKKSPTLGEQPPAGAVVLFDGKNFDAWQPTKWALVPGGAMEVVHGGNLLSKQEFGDQKLHLEFRTPFMPSARGQHRGNSGVYLQGRYEVQVLDSFGLPIKDDECGGIYKKATPKVNACLPPTEWQTYDITFHAPQFDAAGKKTGNVTITVALNGTVILDNVTIDGLTGGAIGPEAKTGPLMLQDHNGDKVQFRNVWIMPLK